MPCLDTDLLAAILRGDPDAEAYLQDATSARESLSTTPINALELFKGAHRSKEREANLTAVRNLLATLRILPLALQQAEEAAEVLESLRERGTPIGDLDSIIGAIVRAHDEVLITRNLKHFQRIPRLRLVGW